ncbi:hypothetical protein AAG906_006812 [Vitis piasezkii]
MLMEVAPWYAHIANYLVIRGVPSEWKAQDKKHFFAKIHAYYWEEPFLFKYCVDQIIRKNMMPLNPILIVDLFDVWGIDFMGPFPMSFGYSYILVGVDYVSKWVEVIPCKSNDHRVVLKFLKENIFSRFGMEELRNDAYNNSNIAKQRLKRWHDQLVSRKEFHNGKRVLLYDSKLHIFLGKLKSRWIGPFTIQQVYSNGVVELLNSNSTGSFKVNGHRLKPFMEPFSRDKEKIILLEPHQA